MSTNRRKLKRNIRFFKRYEDYVSTLSKRNGIKEESSNDEISKEESLNKETSSVDVNMGGNGLETGEFDEKLEENNGREEERINEEVRNLKVLANSDKSAHQERTNSSENTVMHKANGSDDNGGKTKTYANMVKSNEMLVSKNLIYIASKVIEDGMVKILFDEEIISKGCAKWKFTICGHFIGQNMSFYELRIGRSDYARVLVEIEAKKELKNKIKIEYIGKNDTVKGTKEIDVITEEEIKAKIDAEHTSKENNMAAQSEGFIEEYRKRNVNNDGVKDTNKNSGQIDKGKAIQVDKIIRERNKFEVLNEVNTNEETEVRTLKNIMLVDVLKEQEDQSKNVEDVFDNEDDIAQTMTGDNVIGLSKRILN
ncbi:hypothetical protein Tco_0821894 [Tanacetum coccineum]|uniref:Uncharacterized protein n=1 Tax=Tanacetum coccineum TaxID=301880 RepID=A0ABQ5ADI6_9ASTR